MKKSLFYINTLLISLTIFACSNNPSTNSSTTPINTSGEVYFATKQDFLKFATCLKAKSTLTDIETFAAGVGFEPDSNWLAFQAKLSTRIKEYIDLPDGKLCYAEYKNIPVSSPSPSDGSTTKYTREDIIRYFTCALATTNITPSNRGKIAAHLSLTKNDEVWPRLGEPTRDEYRTEIDTIAKPLGCN